MMLRTQTRLGQVSHGREPSLRPAHRVRVALIIVHVVSDGLEVTVVLDLEAANACNRSSTNAMVRHATCISLSTSGLNMMIIPGDHLEPRPLQGLEGFEREGRAALEGQARQLRHVPQAG